LALEQIHYSIDKEPGICVQLIAQAIRAQQAKPDARAKTPSAEEIQAAAEMFKRAWEKITGGLG